MNDFLPSGRLAIGANYWASHSGLAMWRDWRPEVIDEDFATLAAAGLESLRVFPLWPDFQPIQLLRADKGRPVEFRCGEEPLPDGETFQSGVSPVMLERFGTLADLAGKHGLDLIVGLITGWMSGRLFVPPGLEGLNPITDPRSQMWQLRLARTMVAQFKGHPAIKAWDLGNECNVMGAATREQAWVWTAALANAIRAEDGTRPIISGMHSLGVDPADPANPWAIRDQGELTDFLTTHPYPLFTAHCNREPLDAMRPVLHGTAETCLYADLGARPAFVEEFGNLGPMMCGEEETAAFLRVALASLWAHDGRGAFWWCAHDQTALDYAPYDWTVLERELGLLRADRSPKPLLTEMGAFRKALAALPFAELPRRRVDAVCILTPGQDQWGVAYSAFLLAKQAGFDVRFHYADRSLPEADLYLLPSLGSLSSLSRRRENELWDRVQAGAAAYVSLADGMLGRFNEAAGVEVLTRAERRGPATVVLPGGAAFELATSVRYELRTRTAEVIAREADGQPFFWKNRLGRGEVFVLCAPLEAAAAATPGAFAEDGAPPCWQFYKTMAENALNQRRLRKTNPWLGITEHAFADGSFAVVAVNYSRREAADTLALPAGFGLADAGSGRAVAPDPSGHYPVQLPPHGYAVWLARPTATSS